MCEVDGFDGHRGLALTGHDMLVINPSAAEVTPWLWAPVKGGEVQASPHNRARQPHVLHKVTINWYSICTDKLLIPLLILLETNILQSSQASSSSHAHINPAPNALLFR